MKAKFNNLKISGIFVILPQNEYFFEDDMKFNSLSEKRNRALASVMGYHSHRFFKPTSYTSKIASWGIKELFSKNLLKKEDIKALIVSNMSPDFIMPGTSKIIAKNCELENEIFTLDMNEACAGFVNGVFMGFSILNSLSINDKVILINGDCFGKELDRSNTTSYPLAGEAISITILEKSSQNNEIFYDCRSDSKDWEALVSPDRGFRKLTNEELELLKGPKYGNNAIFEGTHMDGQAVFNYVLQDVSAYLDDFLAHSNTDKNDVDYYFFHQPNNFMLEKLALKFGISNDKMPKDVVKYYGNSNSATIPVCIAHNAKNQMLDDKSYKCLFSGFGAGLSYAGLLMEVSKLDFCQMVVSEF